MQPTHGSQHEHWTPQQLHGQQPLHFQQQQQQKQDGIQQAVVLQQVLGQLQPPPAEKGPQMMLQHGQQQRGAPQWAQSTPQALQQQQAPLAEVQSSYPQLEQQQVPLQRKEEPVEEQLQHEQGAEVVAPGTVDQPDTADGTMEDDKVKVEQDKEGSAAHKTETEEDMENSSEGEWSPVSACLSEEQKTEELLCVLDGLAVALLEQKQVVLPPSVQAAVRRLKDTSAREISGLKACAVVGKAIRSKRQRQKRRRQMTPEEWELQQQKKRARQQRMEEESSQQGTGSSSQQSTGGSSMGVSIRSMVSNLLDLIA